MTRSGRIFFIVILLFNAAVLKSQDAASSAWVDSIFKKLSLEEKIGQLFIIRAHTDLGPDHIASVKSQIKKYHIGGLCFFQGTPQKQAELTSEYQKLSSLPLIVSMDAEWGLGMRFKEKALSFPHQLMLGAVPDINDIEEMGYAIGKQLKAVGVNVSFSPVADVNNNAANPVIGDRSFGEDKIEVAKRSIAYAKGLAAAGILACGKHFPGHGDTDTDSHLDLPVITHSMSRLQDVELYPFQQMIEAGIPAMMVAHLHVPAIDSTKNLSTTLSPKAINILLRNEMGFKGLVITDGLEMQGVAKHFNSGEVAVMSIEAGNDMLLLPEDIQLAFSTLKDGFSKGRLDMSMLDEKVKRILAVKYSLGLDSLVLPNAAEAGKMAFDPYAKGVKHKLIEQAITVVQNQKALIPLVNLKEPKIATLSIGDPQQTPFQKRLNSYLEATHFNLPKSFDGVDIQSLLTELRKYPRLIVSIHGLNSKLSSSFGLSKEILGLIQNLNRQQDIILVVFGSPYSLKYFENIDHLVMAYEDTPETQDITAQGLVGVFGFRGKLPVTASNIFPVHHGFTTPSLKRLGYSPPERVGMASDSLKYIKTIVDQMIRIHAAPGCQVLIAKDGRIVYEQAFGKHTYKGNDTVRLSDLYDVASVTKVVSTTLAVMKLYEEGYLDLDKTLGEYLPWLANTDKADMELRKVLAHHAGLQSFIRFYESTLSAHRKPPKVFDDIYQTIASPEFGVCVADNMWMNNEYLDTIRRQIIRSGLNREDTYVYSDLGFLMMPEIIRNQTGVLINRYVDSVFYKPLFLDRIGYRPLLRFGPEEIVPSEDDDYFRCQVLDGYVHDMACAMLGGVCGHAGIFSNAHDIAVVLQMLMNGGSYGGKKFIDPDVLKMFTTRYGRSTRRGLGFDMKELDSRKNLLTSYLASSSTYGHTGFTGICVWNDPKNNLVYIFLSNRTFPSMNNNMLSTYNIRERIHSRAYKAIKGYQAYTHDLIAG
ncbi:MAG TPA: glycoside hydrolase family 3 N-terminal domain-containing protein [Saprospiraceae bacterium]|nr:glycoside hydrolase family 3 N-terminal domain-containing protein [Saprospiraceae bacterium]